MKSFTILLTLLVTFINAFGQDTLQGKIERDDWKVLKEGKPYTGWVKEGNDNKYSIGYTKDGEYYGYVNTYTKDGYCCKAFYLTSDTIAKLNETTGLIESLIIYGPDKRLNYQRSDKEIFQRILVSGTEIEINLTQEGILYILLPNNTYIGFTEEKEVYLGSRKKYKLILNYDPECIIRIKNICYSDISIVPSTEPNDEKVIHPEGYLFEESDSSVVMSLEEHELFKAPIKLETNFVTGENIISLDGLIIKPTTDGIKMDEGLLFDEKKLQFRINQILSSP